MRMLGTAHLTTVNDTTIAWSELGNGSPLVLLHGIADSHRAWRIVAPKLARHFHVYMLDLPGHGFSARPDAPYTLSWFADTLALWMDAIGLERSHICGHSFGGGIAQWMLLEHRKKIDRLALCATGGFGREVSAALRWATLPFLAPLLEDSLFGFMTGVLMRWALVPGALEERCEIEHLSTLNAAPNGALAFRRAVSSCIDWNGQSKQTWQYFDRFESLPPLAVFWGDSDPIIPVSHAYEAARRLGDVSVKVYPHVGHSPHLEAPDEFAGDLLAFLDAPDRTSCSRVPRSARMTAMTRPSERPAPS
jgi:pimeloyl-ACP methyl ester carboxylesterase